jgi:hypothetical protein
MAVRAAARVTRPSTKMKNDCDGFCLRQLKANANRLAIAAMPGFSLLSPGTRSIKRMRGGPTAITDQVE